MAKAPITHQGYHDGGGGRMKPTKAMPMTTPRRMPVKPATPRGRGTSHVDRSHGDRPPDTR